MRRLKRKELNINNFIYSVHEQMKNRRNAGKRLFMKISNTKFLTIGFKATLAAILLSACDKTGSAFSVGSTSQSFQQSSQSVVQKKIDILWVVDNSASMGPFQQKLVTNFNSFIQDFVKKGYDFHIAVTTTEAYLSGGFYTSNLSYSAFKDGTGTTHTGFSIIDPTTPNIVSTFTTNATQGDQGSGDENAFSSIKAAFQNPANASFLRPDSFLGVIILSDEDDFSDPSRQQYSWSFGGIPDHDYMNPGLETVDSYVNYLDLLTHSTSPTSRKYNVSAVTVLDSTCLNSHKVQSATTIIGQRYMDLVTKTGGVLGDICSADYATSLIQIQQKIIELSTQFFLSRMPIPSSIRIVVDNVLIAQDATNGWTYNSTNNSISFHGTAVPKQGAAISVRFDPATVGS